MKKIKKFRKTDFDKPEKIESKKKKKSRVNLKTRINSSEKWSKHKYLDFLEEEE